MSRSSLGRTGGWVWNPAGPDDQLALACKDLEAGRFGIAREVLRACFWDFEARSRRSALLAATAARLDAVDHWLAEEPGNPDALLLAARTAVVRTRRAVAAGSGDAQSAHRARQLCLAAAAVHPADPTPWVAQLMLAEAVGNKPLTIAEGYALYMERHAKRAGAAARARHAAGRPWSEQLALALSAWHPPLSVHLRRSPWPLSRVADTFQELLAQGPWDLMFEVWARDPLGREAHHWLIDCLPVHDAHRFATVVSMAVPNDASVQLLPLVANLAEYRWLSASGAASGPERAAADVWASKALHGVCVELYFGWFKKAEENGGMKPVADYSLLAHALVKVGEAQFAARVLEAMKPFGPTYPWSVTGTDGAREFLRVAEHLGVSPPRALSAWEHRELHR
jgi:hypothetical protein